MLSELELENAALKKLNELFEESNRAAKIGVWELDITTNTLFWSSTTKVIHGVNPNYNPTVEEAFKFIKPGTNLELLKTYVDKAITNNIPYDIEMQIIKKNGTEIWTRARGTPEFRDGKCVRLFGTFQDIQEQKGKEIELIDSELKMGAIFNNNIDALLLTNPIDGSILRANKAATALFGYTEKDFKQIGRNGIIDTSDPKLPSLLEKRKNESHITTDLIGIKKNGDRFPIRVSSGIFTDAQGNTQASTCIIDMTEVNHYQKQIEDSARKFKGIFNSTFQFIGFLTPDGTLTEANNTAIQFAGLKPEDVIGKKFWDCHWWSISDKTREELRLNIERAAKGEFVQYEVEILGANNSITTILFNLKPLFNEKNEVYSIIPEGRLIQDIVDTRKELISKNEELSRFTTIVSHDLKEPLRMVSQFMFKLEQKYSGLLDEKARQYIYYAVDGAKRMSKMIDELLEYSRIAEKDKTFEKFKSKYIVEEVIASFSQFIEEKNIQINIASLPEIYAIKTAFKILFNNLLSNAIKYANQTKLTSVEIRCEEDELFWKFSIRDNGIGIDKPFHEMVFQLFSKLNDNNNYKSTGIGLATCKKIVELHHGKIWVESALDMGSTFFFTIKKN